MPVPISQGAPAFPRLAGGEGRRPGRELPSVPALPPTDGAVSSVLRATVAPPPAPFSLGGLLSWRF